jgi:D-Tyr-tRNAtyr deacylase
MVEGRVVGAIERGLAILVAAAAGIDAKLAM